MSFFKDIIKLRQEAESKVSDLPALLALAQEVSQNISHGAHAQKKSGVSDRFWQFREYTPFDRPQDIDWKQSAKGDNVLIRQKELHSTQRTYFWCAGGSSMHFRSDKAPYSKQECAMILSLSLAILLQQGEEHIGVFGDRSTGRGERYLEKAGEYLMRRHTVESPLPESNDFIPAQNSSVVLIGDFLSDIHDIKSSFSALSGHSRNGLVVQVLDPSEILFDYNGRIRFNGTNADDDVLIESVASIRAEYQERINNHIQDVENRCMRNGWHYVLHRTDQSIEQTLSHIITMAQEVRDAS